jgi:hypothetical protein
LASTHQYIWGLWLTAHHAVPKKPHIVEKPEADFGAAKAKGQEEFICKIVGAQLLRPYDVPETNSLEVSLRW